MATATSTIPHRSTTDPTQAETHSENHPSVVSRLCKTALILSAIVATFPASLYVASGYDPTSLLISIAGSLVVLAFIVGPVTALLYYSEHTD